MNEEKQKDFFPYWLLLSKFCTMMVFVVLAGYKALSAPNIIAETLIIQFVPAAVCFVIGVFMSVFNGFHSIFRESDLNTHLFVLAFFIAASVFFPSLVIKDKESKETLVKIATAIASFGAGLPIGGRLKHDNKGKKSK